MKLFLAELRQIFTLRFLLLVAAAAGVYTYSVFHYANTQLSYYFPAEPSDEYTSSLEIEKDLANFVLEDGRTTVTDGDLKTFSDNLAKTKELETFFSETEAFRKYGITCLQDYKDLEEELDDAYYKESSSDPDDPALPALQERSEKIWEIIIASGKEDDFREWMLLEDTIGYMQEDYANRHEPSSYILDTYPSETQRARLKEIYSGDMGSPSSSLPSIMRNALITPYTIFSSFLCFIYYHRLEKQKPPHSFAAIFCLRRPPYFGCGISFRVGNLYTASHHLSHSPCVYHRRIWAYPVFLSSRYRLSLHHHALV